ncbi:MAG: DUF3021 domain-containing protein [Oscillospiraceae bacterium]|nr:DUF3021 domain-containing protein [Oscillospiraceae bacterium]
MKKKLFFRCLLGAPVGLAISTIITVFISIAVGDGQFYPVVPQLADVCGTQLNAVLVQTICALLYGAAWGGASVIWEQEHWSLLRQTGFHFLVCSVFTLPVAYFMYWMEHSALGIFAYFGIFFSVYLLVWLIQYFIIKKRVQEINQKIQQTKNA